MYIFLFLTFGFVFDTNLLRKGFIAHFGVGFSITYIFWGAAPQRILVAIDDSGLDSTIDVYAAKVAEDYTAFKVKGEMPEDSIIPAEWVDGCSAADAQRYFHPVFENKSIEPEAQTLWKYNKLNMGCVDVDQQKTDKVDSKTEGCWLRNCMVGKAFLLFHYLLIFCFSLHY